MERGMCRRSIAWTPPHPCASTTQPQPHPQGITRETASSFVLAVPGTGLELKGQMVPTMVPHAPGCPVGSDALLFMGSPRCASLDEMLKWVDMWPVAQDVG